MRDDTLVFVAGSPVLTAAFDDSITGNVIHSLHVRRGSWWFRPNFGSRLHLIKDMSESSLRLANDYCKEALAWMAPAKVASVEVATSVYPGGGIAIFVAVTRRNQAPQTVSTFFPIV